MNDITLHPFPPLFNSHSEILILGSFPSVKSREQNFFYAHPQNRFWKVLSSIYSSEIPVTIKDKKNFLYSHKIALWDVIASCRITGSSDSSIKDVIANDLSPILASANIKQIYTNGKTAEKYYNKYLLTKTCKKAVFLPSTSPANAAWTIDKLIYEWKSKITATD